MKLSSKTTSLNCLTKVETIATPTQKVNRTTMGSIAGQEDSSDWEDELNDSDKEDSIGSTCLHLAVRQESPKYGPKGKVFHLVSSLSKGSAWVDIAGKKTRGLVDSGASLCFISQKLADGIIGTPNCLQIRRSNMSVLLADGKPVNSQQSIFMKFQIEGIEMKFRFHILPRLNNPLVLGVNFLRKYRGKLIFEEGEIEKPNLILPCRDEWIPANSEHTFNAVILSSVSLKGQVGITESLQEETKLLIKHTLVEPKSSRNIIPVTIANPTDIGFKLGKFNSIGHFSPFNMGNAIPLGTMEGRRNGRLNSMKEEDEFFPINCGEIPSDIFPGTDEPLKYVVSDELDDTQKEQLRKIVESNRGAFVIHENAIGLSTENEITLELKPGAKPCNRPSYRMSPHKEVFQKELLEKQLAQGVLEVCSEPSEYNSPAFLVGKPQGDLSKASGWRIVVDYRWVNQNLKSFSYSFPRTDDLMHTIGRTGARYFSKLDVYSAYHQIPLAPESRHITTFSANGTRYRARVLPMGLKTSGLAFQNVMEQLLMKCKYRNAVAYVDDVAIYSPTWDRHLEDLDEVLKLFIKGNIKLKSEKCEFGTTKMDFLGFRVNQEGISPSPEKIWPIKTFPEPKNVAQVRSFNGMAQFYKRFIKGFAHIMKPLFELLKQGKTFKWTTDCQRSFDKVKNAICTEAILRFPDYNKPFIIFTDSSDTSTGAVITQVDKNGFYRPLEFGGRSLTEQEVRYSVTDRELLGVIFGIKRFHHYIDGTHFTLYSDHTALVSLFNKRENINNGRLARWVDTIMSHDFEVKYLMGRANIVADMLSRRSYPPQPEDPVPMRLQGKVILPPKQLKFSDILITKHFKANDPIPKNPILLGPPRSILTGGREWGGTGKTKRGVIAKKGSEERIQGEIEEREHPTMYSITRAKAKQTGSDSVVTQDTTTPDTPSVVIPDTPTTPLEYTRHEPTSTKVKAAKGRPRGRPRQTRSPQVSRKIAGEKRSKLAQKISPLAEQAVLFISKHNSLNPTREELEKCQKDDIFSASMFNYIQEGTLPNDNSLARQLLLNHDQFVIVDGILFKLTYSVFGKTMDPTLQIVIPEKWSESLIEATHSSPLGGHLGCVKTYNTIRARYYWRSMFKEVHDFVGTCHTCLTTKKRPKHLKTPMSLREPVLTSYTDLTMDAIGPFTAAHDGSRYIHVVVDHATRHVTAWASIENNSAAVALEFFNKVICIHGTPSVLNTDNASVYASQEFEAFCSKFGIKHVFGSAFHSQSQGLCERFNQSIESSLKAFVSDAQKHWSTFLQAVVFGLNNTVCSALGYSPNLLVFGKQTQLPTEAALSLLKSGGVKGIEGLALHLNEQREKIQLLAAENMKETHRKMKLRHDATAVESGFRQGHLVYLHVPSLLKKGTSKKLQATYTGPFMILRETSPVTVILKRLQDGKVLKKSIHVSRLRAPRSRASAKAILKRLQVGPTIGLFDPDKTALNKEQPPTEKIKGKRGRPRKKDKNVQAPKLPKKVRKIKVKSKKIGNKAPAAPRQKYNLRTRTFKLK